MFLFLSSALDGKVSAVGKQFVNSKVVKHAHCPAITLTCWSVLTDYRYVFHTLTFIVTVNGTLFRTLLKFIIVLV